MVAAAVLAACVSLPCTFDGVLVLGVSGRSPECEVTDRRIKVESPASKDHALWMLAQAAKANGADTVKLTTIPYMWEFKNPPRRKVTAVGKGYRCGKGESGATD